MTCRVIGCEETAAIVDLADSIGGYDYGLCETHADMPLTSVRVQHINGDVAFIHGAENAPTIPEQEI